MADIRIVRPDGNAETYTDVECQLPDSYLIMSRADGTVTAIHESQAPRVEMSQVSQASPQRR